MSAGELPKEPARDKHGYRTSPDQTTTGWPPGIPYIVGNEACERFSYYGMRAILFIHLSALYITTRGQPDSEAATNATAVTHLFFAGVYAFPMIGAIIADRLLGKYATIFYLSLVYCAGHAALSAGDEYLEGMFIGLALISIGAGGIKSCVSANVGDQFGKDNWFRVRTVYQIFYFSINFGSFFATLLIPFLRKEFGSKIAFGVPGILMFLATVFFWLGRKKFVHVPPKPGGTLGLLDTLSSILLFMTFAHLFFTSSLPWYHQVAASAACLIGGMALFTARQARQPDQGFLAVMLYSFRNLFTGKEPADAPAAATVSDNDPLARHWFWSSAFKRYGTEATEGSVAVLKIISVFLLVSVFWALFDQHASTWVRQAGMLDLTLWGDKKLQGTQLQALNPGMVMLLIPFLNLVYAWFDKIGLQTTPLRRVTVGMFFTAASFVASALLQQQIESVGEGKVHWGWQVPQYLLVTIGEVMVSVTGLEFAYTQAPRSMKSTVMGFWQLTVTLGNVLVAWMAHVVPNNLTKFFWLFAALMAAAGVLFGIRAYFYVQKDYTQK